MNIKNEVNVDKQKGEEYGKHLQFHVEVFGRYAISGEKWLPHQ